MNLLQEHEKSILISDGLAQFTCTVQEFLRYEPSYIPIASPYISRHWDDLRQYVSTGDTQTEDVFYSADRFEYFCSRRAAYQTTYNAEHQIPPETNPVPATQPALYATLTISGGDGKIPPGLRLGKASQNTLHIAGDVRMVADDATTVVPISMAWRITVCKVRSEKQPELVDSFPVDVALVNGAVAIVDFTVSTAGVYMISDADFDEVDGALVGQSGVKYHVELVGGAKFFKAV